VLGGWLVDQISWRAIFLSTYLWRLPRRTCGRLCLRKPRSARQPLDWNGAAAVAIGLAAITWGLGHFRRRDFNDKTVLGALGSGAAFLAAFVAIEARSGERAMMPLSLYRQRNFNRNQRADTAALLRASAERFTSCRLA